MFLHLSVSHSVHRGWGACMVKGACEVKRESVHGKGVCVAKGGMHGEVGACVAGGACVVGGVHDRGMTGRGHAWHRGCACRRDSH